MMYVIRCVEESFVEPILDGTIRCPVHLYSGQEAIAAGVCAALSVEDYLFGTHRSHGHFLAKGGTLEALVAEVYCREDGCSRGRGGSMHLVDPSVGMLGAAPIVGGTIALAVGAALSSHVRGDRRVTLALFGDGATGEGVLYEAMNFAAVKRLPVIFACENNLYSTHMPIGEIRVAEAIADVARPFGIVASRVDGNDVLAVYDAAAAAVERCRAGDGPVFLEFLTYRLRGHVGPDDNVQGTHTDIRPAAELAMWAERDPVTGFRHRLIDSGVALESDITAIEAESRERVIQAHQFARMSASPNPAELERYVFHD